MRHPRRSFQQIAKLLVHIYRESDDQEGSPYRLDYAALTAVCGYKPTSDHMLQINKEANKLGFVVPHLWRLVPPAAPKDACAVMSHADLRRAVTAGDAVSFTRRQLNNLLRGVNEVNDPRTAARLLADIVSGKNVVPFPRPKAE
jgi:hypothetical protein